MRTARWSAIGLSALGLLLAGGLAFGNGFVKDSALFDKIQIGTTTSKQVAELLGPPRSVSQFPRRGVASWDYATLENFSKRRVDMSIEIDDNGKGIVRSVNRIVQYGP
jgi:outer membrane protein assembly factor BamE (lipoprotein component of BamABCDE complex)